MNKPFAWLMAIAFLLFIARCSMAEEQIAQQPVPVQQLQPMPMFSAPPPVNFGRAYEDCPLGSSCGQAAEFSKALIYGGAFIGGAAVLRPPVTNITNDVSSWSNSSAASSSSSSSSASGGSVIVRPGPVDPSPPPGGGPVDPNPP